MIDLIALFFGMAMAVQEPDAAAAPNADTRCSAEEFKQLDFWLGDWELSWTNADGTEGTARNTITRDAYAGCVVTERFTSPGFEGMSVSTYHAVVGLWRQTWIDDQGGYYALVGGPSDQPGVHFALELTRITERAPYLRMIWVDVTEDSMVWRWQQRSGPDADWEDRWVIRYQRAG